MDFLQLKNLWVMVVKKSGFFNRGVCYLSIAG